MVTLSLHDVGARLGGRAVLSGVTVPALAGGRLTALVGPNAAGKSTLFRRIAGVLKGSGTVRVCGAHRGGICYMPQDTGANAVLTVFESILLAARGGRGAWRVTEAELGHIDRVLDLLNIAAHARGRDPYAVRAHSEPCRRGCPQLIMDGPLHDEMGRDIRAR